MKYLCILCLLMFCIEEAHSQDYSFAHLRFLKSTSSWDKDTILTAYIYGSNPAPPDSIRFDNHSVLGDYYVVRDLVHVSSHTENRFLEYPFTLKQLDLGSYCARKWEVYRVDNGDTLLSQHVNIITEDTLVLQRQTYSIVDDVSFMTNLDSFAYDEFGMLTRSLRVSFQPNRVPNTDLTIERQRDAFGRITSATITSWYAGDLEFVDSQFFEYSKDNSLELATRKEYRNNVLSVITENRYGGWAQFVQETIPYVRSASFVVGGEKYLSVSTRDWTIENPNFRDRSSSERQYDSQLRLTREIVRYPAGDSIVMNYTYYPNGDPKDQAKAVDGAYSPFHVFENTYSERGIDSSVVYIPFGKYDGYFFTYDGKSGIRVASSEIRSKLVLQEKNLEILNTELPARVTIYDVLGRIRFQSQVYSTSLTLTELNAGSYFVKLNDGPFHSMIIP